MQRRAAPRPTSMGARAPEAAGPGNRASPWARGGPRQGPSGASRKRPGASRRSTAFAPAQAGSEGRKQGTAMPGAEARNRAAERWLKAELRPQSYNF